MPIATPPHFLDPFEEPVELFQWIEGEENSDALFMEYDYDDKRLVEFFEFMHDETAQNRLTIGPSLPRNPSPLMQSVRRSKSLKILASLKKSNVVAHPDLNINSNGNVPRYMQGTKASKSKELQQSEQQQQHDRYSIASSPRAKPSSKASSPKARVQADSTPLSSTGPSPPPPPPSASPPPPSPPSTKTASQSAGAASKLWLSPSVEQAHDNVAMLLRMSTKIRYDATPVDSYIEQSAETQPIDKAFSSSTGSSAEAHAELKNTSVPQATNSAEDSAAATQRVADKTKRVRWINFDGFLEHRAERDEEGNVVAIRRDAMPVVALAPNE